MTEEVMKILLEAVCVMIPSECKVYSYTENLRYIIFKYKKGDGGTMKMLNFI